MSLETLPYIEQRKGRQRPSTVRLFWNGTIISVLALLKATMYSFFHYSHGMRWEQRQLKSHLGILTITLQIEHKCLLYVRALTFK